MSKIEKYLGEAMVKYPELDKLAMDIAKRIGTEINQKAPDIKSKMPYREQYVLEKVIEFLERAV